MRRRAHIISWRAQIARTVICLCGCVVILGSSRAIAGVTPEVNDSLSLNFGNVTIQWASWEDPALAKAVGQFGAQMFVGHAGEQSIRTGIERLLGLLAADGYREARIAPSRFVASATTLSFTLTIDPGPVTSISGYRFADLERTDTTWLRSVVSLSTNVPLTTEWLARANERIAVLSNLRMISPPEIEVVSPSDGERTDVVVVFRLAEIAPSRFDGLVAATNDGDASALTGRATLEFAGLFRRDRTASFRYNRQRPEQTSLNLRFAERGAFGRPLGWTFELDELSAAHRRQSVLGSLDYAFTANRRWRLGLSGMWRKVTAGQSYVPPARISEVSMALTRHSGRPMAGRDPLASRTSVTVAVSYSHRRDLLVVESTPHADRLRLQTEAHVRTRITPGWAIEMSSVAQTWSVPKGELGAGDEWYLGGADLLRGYDEQAFAAASGAWVNLEISHTLAPQLSTSLFGEAAYLQLFDAPTAERRPICYGWALGLSSEQRTGRLEIAWRRGAALRDGFLRLKISQSW